MKLADTNYDNSETGCCARLDDAKWEGKTFVWDGKPFLKDHIRSFMHVPLNFGSVISRDLQAVEDVAAYPEEPLTLSDEVSPWGSDILVALDRDQLDGAEVVKLSGTFLTKVFKGPYRDMRKWIRAMEDHVHAQGQEIDKLYYFYSTCPKCAKKLGENKVVLFARLATPSNAPN